MPVTRDTSQRRLQISELVREHGSVQVTSLAKRFGVSMQTVRKDLRFLSDRGVMARAYGGAIDSKVVGGAAAEAPYEAKRTSHLEEKRRIGERAAALVKPGDTIVIDSGTTAIQLAEALPNVEVTVVTNDFGVLSSLAPKSNINIVMLGGELRRKSMSFYGGLTVEARDDGRGAAGATPGNGLRGMRERLSACGGRVDIITAPGQGFALDVRIPLEAAP